MKTPGTAALPTRRLVDVIRSLPHEGIRFRLPENYRVQVTCERSSLNPASLGMDNLPALHGIPKTAGTLPAEGLAALIETRINRACAAIVRELKVAAVQNAENMP